MYTVIVAHAAKRYIFVRKTKGGKTELSHSSAWANNIAGWCRLQGRVNGTSNESSPWRTLGELNVINVTVHYSYTLHNISAYSQYEFRVVPYWLDFGKSTSGIPSNASLPITPVFLYLGRRFDLVIIIIIIIIIIKGIQGQIPCWSIAASKVRRHCSRSYICLHAMCRPTSRCLTCRSFANDHRLIYLLWKLTMKCFSASQGSTNPSRCDHFYISRSKVNVLH